MNKRFFQLGLFTMSLWMFFGCASGVKTKEHSWTLRNTPTEAEWIRNGEPIEFEGEWWYPADSIENLLDSEVYAVGEYKGVQIFIEFTDVKPYDRFYTRFSKNKFRFFEKRKQE